MTTMKVRRKYRNGLVIIIGMIVLIAGCIIGWSVMYARPTRPLPQEVMDFLNQPLPIPNGARDLSENDDYRPVYSSRYSERAVMWLFAQTLDVTDMTPEAVRTIPNTYCKHFTEQFGDIGGYVLFQNFMDPENLFPGRGGWRQMVIQRARDAVLTFSMDVMDYEDSDLGTDGHTSVKRCYLPVDHLDQPIQGRRFVFLRFQFVAFNLSDPDDPSFFSIRSTKHRVMR